MSVGEKKEEALRRLKQKLETTDDEQIVNAILEMISNIDTNEKTIDLSRHYNDIKSKYADVLMKLAQ